LGLLKSSKVVNSLTLGLKPTPEVY